MSVPSDPTKTSSILALQPTVLRNQRARDFEEKEEHEQAETWRHIEAALKMMRGVRATPARIGDTLGHDRPHRGEAGDPWASLTLSPHIQ